MSKKKITTKLRSSVFDEISKIKIKDISKKE